ncbi:MAG: DUF6901 family protein [Planctomycetota bacterium]|jgi:hypothetical protein
MGTYRILYEFELEAGGTLSYPIDLDETTVSLVWQAPSSPPDWTLLDHEQCPECPLDRDTHPRCPIAVNISLLVDRFKDEKSIEKTVVRVVTPERTYLGECSLQDGLFSIFGIIMATSGCPVMNFFKPMARFHLPFSTIEETIVRAASLYLLGEYFRAKKGVKPDFDLADLQENYRKVGAVNAGICERMKAVVKKGDADQNALVILDSFAQMLPAVLSDDLEMIEYLFDEDEPPAPGQEAGPAREPLRARGVAAGQQDPQGQQRPPRIHRAPPHHREDPRGDGPGEGGGGPPQARGEARGGGRGAQPVPRPREPVRPRFLPDPAGRRRQDGRPIPRQVAPAKKLRFDV